MQKKKKMRLKFLKKYYNRINWYSIKINNRVIAFIVTKPMNKLTKLLTKIINY